MTPPLRPVYLGSPNPLFTSIGLIHRISRVFRCATSAGGSLSRTRPGVSSVSTSVRPGTTVSGGAGGFGSTGKVGRLILSSGHLCRVIINGYEGLVSLPG